jgi:hypothetical protein
MSFNFFRSDDLHVAYIIFRQAFRFEANGFIHELAGMVKIPENYLIINLFEEIAPQLVPIAYLISLFIILLAAVLVLKGKRAVIIVSKENNPEQRLKKLISRIIILLLPVAAMVFIFDPFYQFHQPLPKLKAVLNDKENQCIGSLRTFDYNAVLLGSSVVENFDNAWFDNGFGVTAIKAVRASGSTSDLLYLLSEAFKANDLKYVFYGLDTSALITEPRVSFFDEGMPVYLYSRHHFDSFPYLFNKEILLEKIPYLIIKSLYLNYDEGKSYNWAAGKEFSVEWALKGYDRPASVMGKLDADYFEHELRPNLRAIAEMISDNKETEFYFFFPPYSLLWWDNIYRSGQTEAYFYIIEETVKVLLEYENVEVFYFQNDKDTIINAGNYMDMIHYSEQINYAMYLDMEAGRRKITHGNFEANIEEMRILAKDISEKYIYDYYTDN